MEILASILKHCHTASGWHPSTSRVHTFTFRFTSRPSVSPISFPDIDYHFVAVSLGLSIASNFHTCHQGGSDLSRHHGLKQGVGDILTSSVRMYHQHWKVVPDTLTEYHLSWHMSPFYHQNGLLDTQTSDRSHHWHLGYFGSVSLLYHYIAVTPGQDGQLH